MQPRKLIGVWKFVSEKLSYLFVYGPGNPFKNS
jgi:hypothetical protein